MSSQSGSGETLPGSPPRSSRTSSGEREARSRRLTPDEGREPGIIDPSGPPECGQNKSTVTGVERYGLDYPRHIERQVLRRILHRPRRRVRVKDERDAAQLDNLHHTPKSRRPFPQIQGIISHFFRQQPHLPFFPFPA